MIDSGAARLGIAFLLVDTRTAIVSQDPLQNTDRRADHAGKRALLAASLMWIVLFALGLAVLVSNWVLAVAGAAWLVAARLALSRRDRTVLRGPVSRITSLYAGPLCVSFLAAVVLLLLGAGLVRWRGALLETDAITLGLALWLIGLTLLVLRGFARWRRSVWVLGIVAAAVVAVAIAVFVAWQSTDIVLALGAGLAILAVLSWFVGYVVLRHPSDQRAWRFLFTLDVRHFHRDAERSRRAVLAAARTLCWIAASGLVLLAATATLVTAQQAAPSQVGRFGGQLHPPSGNGALVSFYAPVLQLAEGEKWRAADPMVVLQSAFLEQPPPPESCTGSALAPCGTVQITNDSDLLTIPALVPRPGVFAGGVVYPHVVDTTAVSETFPANSIPARTSEVIEYWIYYAGDDWSTPSAVGQITQGHDGDWEWVGVGLDGAGDPLFTAYSAHCGGTWRPWASALAVAEAPDGLSLLLPGTDDSTPLGSTPDPRTPQVSHPLIAVARGSHANYPTSASRSPDWIGCEHVGGLAGVAIDGLSYIANIRETISNFGSTQIPSVASIDNSVLSLPLFWGPKDTKTVDGFALSPAAGPASPVYHPEYAEPLQVVFNKLESNGRFVNTYWSCDPQLPACT